MNIVHEQRPNSDSETVLSPKTGSKLSQVRSAPNLAQLEHTWVPRRARVAVSWLLRSAVSWAQWPCRGPQPCRVTGVWPCRRRCAGRQACRVASLPRDTKPCLMLLLVTIHHSVLQYKNQAASPCWSQYTLVYCNTPKCIVTEREQAVTPQNLGVR